MKRIKYILLGLVASSFVLQSCSEDKMDDINKNQNDPEFMESKYIITDVMNSSAYNGIGGDLAFYASVYTELLGGAHAQMHNAQARLNEPIANTTYNNNWNSLYRNLRNLHIIINKCSEGGEEAGNYHTLGVAQIMTAFNLGILTDLFGDIPYFEALRPLENPQAKLDKQEDIYKEIFRLLDESIANLDKTSKYGSLGNQDIIYSGGNVKSWKKAAYGLKAKYLMRLSAVQPNYQAVLDNVALSFENSAQDFRYQNGKVDYTFYNFYDSRAGLASSKTLFDLMSSIDPQDPRLNDYFVKIGEGDAAKEIKLIDHSTDVAIGQALYSPSGLSYFTDNDDRNARNAIYLMSYHELLFIKAEAEARLNKTADAVETLKLAVEAGLNKKQTFTYPGYVRNIPASLSGLDLLKRIAQEKYISFFEVESIEAFNDIRRWKAMGENLIELKHRNPELFPKRYPYGNSDVSNNPNVRAAYGDGSYVYTENVWWAGGTR
ncbi:SusD/RagB family nutrient-binding outer membrane lipoprotein [Myroides phaeus]|uniref:Starch-binding associating with outer membrane n=1 Tax=Myroides phaeus TaxID=702745 RepID=A0A1G8BKM9_9FLAO|nr:SusD/RagB family nutrient-binding outer membrane lipoprotein [Myroides phaeus]MEC4116159.1 SusD/RagB family nutrient-binding outer membrane lipoprotein [Myroides phaeus]SDH33776.1 Starch-binding associating with outer membrane [Myroides phaeus]